MGRQIQRREKKTAAPYPRPPKPHGATPLHRGHTGHPRAREGGGQRGMAGKLWEIAGSCVKLRENLRETVENCRKLRKIAGNCGKLREIAENCGKLCEELRRTAGTRGPLRASPPPPLPSAWAPPVAGHRGDDLRPDVRPRSSSSGR